MIKSRDCMRREWRWALAAAVALTVGATCAGAYARLAAPYYAVVTGLLAEWHPWRIDEVVVVDEPNSRGAVLRMTGVVFRQGGDPRAAAQVVMRIHVGETVDVPIVFWTLLLMWPVTAIRQRLLRIAVGVPIFLGVEAATTGCQLIYGMPRAMAMIAGHDNVPTSWDLWVRFLGGGGRLVLALAAALLVISIATRLQSTSVARGTAPAG
jgi:hypothetical protein